MSKLWEEFQNQTQTAQKPSDLYSEFLKTQQPKELPVQHTGFWSTLGDYANYMGAMVGKDAKFGYDKDKLAATAKQLGSNFAQFGQDIGDFIQMKPNEVPSFVSKKLDEFKGHGIDNPLSIPGTFLGLASIPVSIIGALTGTDVGQNGEPIPATPEKAAQNIQSTIGLAASGLVAGKVLNMMEPSEAALIKPVSIPGNLIRAAYPKAVASLASGATYGAISGMGSEDQLAQLIGSALGFTGAGFLLHGVGKVTGLSESWSGKRAENARLIKQEISQNSANLAATRFMEITDGDTPESIAAKTKAFAVSQDYVTAKIDATLTMGKQIVLDDVPGADKIAQKYLPSKRPTPLYTPSEETKAKLDNYNITNNKTQVEVTDPFDKATLVSEKDPDVMKELQGLKLTGAEIESHRNFLKNKIDSDVKSKTNISTLPTNDVEERLATATDKGRSLVETMQDGDNITDVNGKKWTRVGSTITDGQQALPINSEITHRLIGLDRTFNPNAPVMRLPKQSFNPEYGREMNTPSIYQGPRNTTLISSYPLHDDIESFFKSTGYLPDEPVSVHGQPYTVTGMTDKGYASIKSLQNGVISNVFPDEIKRLPQPISSDLSYFNRQSLYDGMYKDFRQTFDLDQKQNEPFGTTMVKFAKRNGITNSDDIIRLSHEFSNRMMDEVVDGLEPAEKEQYQKAIDKIGEWHQWIQQDASRSLNQALLTNNMSLISRGGGIYDIKDLQSGKILQTVHSLEDAQKYVSKSGQANGFDLDGGPTNTVPIAGGTMLDDYTPNSNKWAKIFDENINAGRPSSTIAQQGAAIKSLDERGSTNGQKLNFTQHFNALQYLQTKMRNVLSTDPTIKKLSDKVNTAIKADNNIPLNRKAAIYDQLTSIDPDELSQRFGVPKDLATQIGKVGSSEVIDFLSELQKQTGNINPTNPKYQRIASQLASKYDPKVGPLGYQLIQAMDGTNKVAVSIKMAQMMEHGPSSTSLTPSETKYKAAVKDAHESFPGVADPMWSYLPNAKLADLTNYNPFTGHSKEFLPDYISLSSDGNKIEIDPSTILYNLRRSSINSAQYIKEDNAYFNGSNKQISPNEIYNRAQSYLYSLMEKNGDDDATKQWKQSIASSVQIFQHHLDDVRGVPDLSEQLGRAAEASLKEQLGEKYKSMPEAVRFGSSLVYASLLGLRSIFALRDLSNVYQNAFNRMGTEFALKAMGKSVSLDAVQALVDQGEIPNKSNFKEILNPNESLLAGMERLANKFSKGADVVSNWSTKLNGQQLAHAQASAGVWLQTFKMVGDLSEKMFKSETSKADAYDKLAIDQLHPADAKAFDDLITAGKSEQAARYLARTLVREFATNYGMNNAPSEWKTWFGKLAGGFGQWATNQIQTNANNYLRGTPRQRLTTLARTSISNSALWGIGATTGLNLSRWMITPLGLPGISPLLNGVIGGVQTTENTLNIDPAIANPAGIKVLNMLPYKGNIAHLYLPFSYFAQGEMDAMDMIKGGFGPAAWFSLFTGADVIKDTQSPLQQWLNLNPEWTPQKGKRAGIPQQVPDKGMGGKFISAPIGGLASTLLPIQ